MSRTYKRRKVDSCNRIVPVCVLAVVMTAIWCSSFVVAAPYSNEHSVKAAYLYKFFLVTQWPVDRAKVSDISPSICLVKSRKMISVETFQAIIDLPINERPLQVISLPQKTSDGMLERCDLLFLSGLSHSLTRNILTQTRGRAILTVGDIPNFLDMGGMIQLEILNDHISFRINQNVLEAERFRLPSYIYQLARDPS